MKSEWEVTWPYMVEEVEESLNPELIERLGREILARGATHGRLVAFLGAGMSMAYGRESWDSLVSYAIGEVVKLRRRIRGPSVEGVAKYPAARLTATMATLESHLGFSEAKDPAAWLDEIRTESNIRPLILQLCAKALELGAECLEIDPEAFGDVADMPLLSVKQLIKNQLDSARTHDSAFVSVLDEINKMELLSHGYMLSLRSSIAAAASKIQAMNLPARRHFLSLLHCAERANWVLDPKPASVREREERSLHCNGDDSALSMLHHDFSIHRFATTNYDLEIERALDAAGLHKIGPVATQKVSDSNPRPTPTDHTYTVVDLTPETTAGAIAFAVDGRRRHSQVMHLHGSLGRLEHMIVSERDYQLHYLRRSPRRDLLDISVRTLFGASPILFIGTSVAEDDVLRPLREFMGAAPRRGDRVAVALLPAKSPAPQLALEKIRCLVRYGIFVIHYGHESEDHFKNGTKRVEPWLSRFTGLVKKLRERLKALNSDCDADEALEPLAAPTKMEGLKSSSRAWDVRAEVDLLNALVIVLRPAAPAVPAPIARFVNALLDEISTSVTSAFVCARLKVETGYRQEWASRMLQPLASHPFTRRLHRMSLHGTNMDLLSFGTLRDASGSRFEQHDANSIDPRWTEFLEGLKSREAFLGEWDRRRFIMMSMPRGSGKGSMFDGLSDFRSPTLVRLLRGLAPENEEVHWRIGLFGLGFLFDVSAVASAVAQVLMPTGKQAEVDRVDVVAQLEKAMESFAAFSESHPQTRALLVLSNVGAMFDRDGQTKNGQVQQLLRLMEHRDYRRCRLDILMFCDEDHLPKRFRAVAGRLQNALDEFVRRRVMAPAKADVSGAPNGTPSTLPKFLNQGRLLARRPNADRLREMGVLLEDPIAPWSIVHVPSSPLPNDVVRAFSRLAALLDRTVIGADIRHKIELLYNSVNSHRIALTLILALAEDRQCIGADAQDDRGLLSFLESARCAMALHLHESTPDTAIQFTFDEWAGLHLRRGDKIMSCSTVESALQRVGLESQAMRLQSADAPKFWQLCVEILWHLAVLSHPADVAVLARCPEIEARAAKLVAPNASRAERVREWIALAAETCVQRCLAFRVSPRDRDPGASSEAAALRHNDRYVLHRLIQRYFLRMMGGRNIEGMEWDQFASSLYASQPDEIPTLSDSAHTKIRGLIRALIRYGEWPHKRMTNKEENEFQDALRAAYFVARATYSVGVLSHIALRDEPAHPPPRHGHMEEYRRLVRSITHRALRQPTPPRKRGTFQVGEIVWLHAECGVISLTQGKLEDAESSLQLALSAVRRIEQHDTGSLHVRLLLHSALVRLERGRAASARQILEPIARRADDNRVPPLIAQFYLGLIDHIGGDYHTALERYDLALSGLRELKRTRATAFVLKSRADALFSHHPDRRAEAIELAKEAISVAQRGGHEDVRCLATLSLIRLRVADRAASNLDDSYRQLELAEKYAQSMGMPRISAQAHEVRAHVLLSQGETRLSAQEAAEAAQISGLYDMKLIKAKSLLTLARVYRLRGEVQQAREIIRFGLEIAHSCDYGSCMRSLQLLDSQLPVVDLDSEARI